MPIAVKMPPPGNSRRKECIEFNRKGMADSAGRLPPYENDREGIQIASVTCGHTSQTLRCVYHGSPSDHAKLSADGKLSLELLRMAQSSYAEAVDKGLTWEVIPAAVEEAHPVTMELFQ